MSEDRFAMADLTGGQMNAIVKMLGGHDGALRLLRGELKVVPTEPKKLLELVMAVSVPAVERFVAEDHFKVDTGRKAKVKIAALWDNFTACLLPKVEEGVLAGELKVYKLLQSSLDAPIMTELGDLRSFATTLADLWAMLEKQPNGEQGPLLTNSWANIFYIHDKDGKLWAVVAVWDAGSGWNVEAYSVEEPDRWDDGVQVLSR
jgi:hypothetical protein